MYKIIMADDSALSLKGLEKNLDFASIGAELVCSFLNGMDVLAYLREHSDIDLLISDIRMPHITGLELAREALTLNKMMKIVLISAYDDFEYAQEALRIGVTDYVQKPIQYDQLQQTIQNALRKLEEERALLRRLEEARPRLRELFYQKLVRSRPRLAEHMLAREAEYLGITVRGGSFLCVAVAGEEAGESPATDTESMLLRAILQTDALRTWFSAEMECHVIEEQDDTLVLLHAPLLGAEALTRQAVSLCERYAAQHADSHSAYFGIGTPQATLWEITRSIETARRMVSRRFVYDDQTVFYQTPDAKSVLPFLTHITEAQAEIINLLFRRERGPLDRMVDRITHEAITHLQDQTLIVPYLVVLVSGLLGQLRQNDVDLSEAEHALTVFSAKSRRPVNSQDIEEMLRRFFDSAIAALDQSQQTYRHKMLTTVKEYIAANLSDSKLHLESIADEVHVTYSHLSRIFKQSEGINVSDYITKMRIERAMRLLRSTSDPISLVSDQAGYSSPYYFSACFKRIVGQTPSEYRKG